MPGYLNPASFLEGLYALKPFSIWASAFAKHLGRWSMWRPRAASHQTVPVLIFALLECAQKKPKEGCCVRFIYCLKIKQTLLALNHPLVNVWHPVLAGESGMGWIAQVLIEIELMSWWKLEESHSSFWFGLLFLSCTVQSWHFLADGSVMLNFIFTVVHATLFGLILSASHSDLHFCRFLALSKPPNLCQHFKCGAWNWGCFQGREKKVPGRGEVHGGLNWNSFILVRCSVRWVPLTWVQRALRQVYRDENTNEFMPGKFDNHSFYLCFCFQFATNHRFPLYF